MTIVSLIILVLSLIASWSPTKALYLAFGLLVLVVLAAHKGVESERAAQRAQEIAECRDSAWRIGVFTNPVTGKSAPIMTCPRE